MANKSQDRICPLNGCASVGEEVKIGEPPSILRRRLPVLDGQEVSGPLSLFLVTRVVSNLDGDSVAEIPSFRMEDGNVNEVVTAINLETPGGLPARAAADTTSGIRIAVCLGVKPEIEGMVSRDFHEGSEGGKRAKLVSAHT